jgi:hypothetical protein
VNNGFGVWKHLVSDDRFNRRNLARTAGCEDGVYRSTDNDNSWTVAGIDLTSTAAILPIMREGVSIAW